MSDEVIQSVELNAPTPGPSPKHSPPKRGQPPQSSSSSSSRHVKKPRFNQTSGSRRGGTGFTKLAPRTSVMVSPVSLHRQVYVSSLGLISFVSIIYDWCIAKDYRWGNRIAGIQMEYASLVAFIARLAFVAQKAGTRYDSMTNRLVGVARTIPLPDCICKLIESIGIVARPQQPTCAPLFLTSDAWQARGDSEAQPGAILWQAGIQVPDNPWALDTDYIADYVNGSARAQSKNLSFRPVDFDNPEGRVEMLWGYALSEANARGIVPYGPCQITQAEAELSAVYGFRQHFGGPVWPDADGNHLVLPDFEGDIVEPSTFLADLAGKSSEMGQR